MQLLNSFIVLLFIFGINAQNALKKVTKNEGLISKEKCKEFISKKIKSLEESKLLNEFPHLAAVGFDGQDNETDAVLPVWLCGGNLISEKYVLTVAHCTHHKHFGSIKYVRLGNLNSTEGTEYPKIYNVTKIIVHPNFKSRLVYNDVALLELESAVDINDHIKPACLYTDNIVKDTNFLEIGFNRDSPTISAVSMKAISYNKCNDFYNITRNLPEGVSKESQICAAADNRENAPFSAASLTTFNENYYIVGISSFGKPTGEIDVYTRVSNFIDWIESIVWT